MAPLRFVSAADKKAAGKSRRARLRKNQPYRKIVVTARITAVPR
jgi:hypothetical protein